MASRFWAGSSSESGSDNESAGSEVEDVKLQANRWDVDSESESDDDTRVVVSGKDKALQALQLSVDSIKRFLKNYDWSKIQTEFDGMAKQLENAKAKQAIAASGYPKYYIRCMAELEDEILEKLKSKSDKKLSKENSKALIRMKGKIKKHNESIAKELIAYRDDPSAFASDDDESDEDSDEDSDDDDDDDDEDEDEDEDADEDEDEDDDDDYDEDDDDEDADDDDDDDDQSDSDEWQSESSSSSSSDDDNVGELKGRARWLKKVPTTTTKSKDKSQKVKQVRGPKEVKDKEVKKAAVEEDLKLSKKGFDNKIKETIALRGKRGTDLGDQLTILRKLVNYSRRLGPAREVVATMHMVGTLMFDTSSKIDKVLSTRLWKQAHSDLQNILDILERNPGFKLAPLSSEDQADLIRAGANKNTDAANDEEDDDPSVADHLPAAGAKGLIKVSGDLAAFIERLNDEYVKSLQQTDPHTAEYIARLYDEGLLSALAKRVQDYFKRQEDHIRAASVALIQAELMYYKHDSIANALHLSNAKRAIYGEPSLIHPACESQAAEPLTKFDSKVVHPASVLGHPKVDIEPMDVEKDLSALCLYVYKYADDRSKTRAMLCHIYHHAIHDRFHEARDLLLMSHLQETIVHTDIATQILFNRMMAQLGLCAFRLGLIWEAHACLSEICTGSKTKELLAQGVASFRHQERNPEEERLEKRRQVPYHMHINLELLEVAHLTSAMLLEVPNMVLARTQDRRRVLSKAFRKLLEFHDRLIFAGPPENTRDHIVAAAKYMSQGQWQKSVDLICGLSVWELLPGAGTAQKVKDMVQHKIQVESLRSYLMAFSEEYDALNLSHLCAMFELDSKTVHSVVSKMMINEELQGAWDQGSQSIVLHKVERTRLQQLALQYSEKIGVIVENNERMMDLRSVSQSSKEESSNTHRRGQNDNRSNQKGGVSSQNRNQGRKPPSSGTSGTSGSNKSSSYTNKSSTSQPRW